MPKVDTTRFKKHIEALTHMKKCAKKAGIALLNIDTFNNAESMYCEFMGFAMNMTGAVATEAETTAEMIRDYLAERRMTA
jgi:hypothetical protein